MRELCPRRIHRSWRHELSLPKLSLVWLVTPSFASPVMWTNTACCCRDHVPPSRRGSMFTRKAPTVRAWQWRNEVWLSPRHFFVNSRWSLCEFASGVTMSCSCTKRSLGFDPLLRRLVTTQLYVPCEQLSCDRHLPSACQAVMSRAIIDARVKTEAALTRAQMLLTNRTPGAGLSGVRSMGTWQPPTFAHDAMVGAMVVTGKFGRVCRHTQHPPRHGRGVPCATAEATSFHPQRLPQPACSHPESATVPSTNSAGVAAVWRWWCATSSGSCVCCAGTPPSHPPPATAA